VGLKRVGYVKLKFPEKNLGIFEDVEFLSLGDMGKPDNFLNDLSIISILSREKLQKKNCNKFLKR
jgi:hypothetical protein